MLFSFEKGFIRFFKYASKEITEFICLMIIYIKIDLDEFFYYFYFHQGYERYTF